MATVERRALTDAYLRNLAEKPPKAETVISDTLSPLRVRARPNGNASFHVWQRFGGAKNPTTRTIGKVGTVKLADAREMAREWVRVGKAGGDPAADERARRKAEAEAAERQVTFGTVLDDYARLVLSKQRRGKVVERELRRNFLSWAEKPLRDLRRGDVVRAIDAITGRGCPYEARNSLSALRTMLNWAAERHDLEHLPTDRLKIARIVGPTPPRQRVLNDVELFALWRATRRLPYPFGPALRLLALTAGRHSEIRCLRWREIDLAKRTAVIPPERFKSDAEHRIALSAPAVAILKALPRGTKGDAVFSCNEGATPIFWLTEAQQRVSRRMRLTLKALARVRGDDPRTVDLASWVPHDLRRTARSNLSALRVPDHVAELCLGHGRRGIQRVYDRHAYEEEVAEAMEAWGAKLMKIVGEPEPGEAKVLRFPDRRERLALAAAPSELFGNRPASG